MWKITTGPCCFVGFAWFLTNLTKSNKAKEKKTGGSFYIWRSRKMLLCVFNLGHIKDIGPVSKEISGWRITQAGFFFNCLDSKILKVYLVNKSLHSVQVSLYSNLLWQFKTKLFCKNSKTAQKASVSFQNLIRRTWAFVAWSSTFYMTRTPYGDLFGFTTIISSSFK